MGLFLTMIWYILWMGLLVASLRIGLDRSDELVNWPRLTAYPYREMAHPVKVKGAKAGAVKEPFLKVD
jgi:hypothetical protein